MANIRGVDWAKLSLRRNDGAGMMTRIIDMCEAEYNDPWQDDPSS